MFFVHNVTGRLSNFNIFICSTVLELLPENGDLDQVNRYSAFCRQSCNPESITDARLT